MSQIESSPNIKHFSTVHRIIVDHRSWEHFEKFCQVFSRDHFLISLKQHPLDSTDVTFLYYLYIDPNDLFQDGRHSYERYLRVYKNNKGVLTIRIGTCELFNDQTKEIWHEEEKIEAKDLDEVANVLSKRFEEDLNEMTAFFH